MTSNYVVMGRCWVLYQIDYVTNGHLKILKRYEGDLSDALKQCQRDYPTVRWLEEHQGGFVGEVSTPAMRVALLPISGFTSENPK